MDVGIRSGQEKYIVLMRNVAVIPISTSGLLKMYADDTVFSPPVQVNIVP